MQIRREFQEFIGQGMWGKQKQFYEPSMEEVQAGAFELPLRAEDQSAVRQMNLDFLNIGHNVEGFNKLEQPTREGVAEVLARQGTWGEIYALPQGEQAGNHMQNVSHAQESLSGAMFGPAGLAVLSAMQVLSEKMPSADGRLVSMAMRQGGPDCLAADLYPLSDVNYLGQTLQGITEEPIGRVYVDLTNGAAFMMPDDKFHGRS